MATNNITREECLSTHQILMEKIDNLVEKVNNIAITVAELPGNLVKELDERYADKKTEDKVDKIFWLIVSSVILAVLYLVINNNPIK